MLGSARRRLPIAWLPILYIGCAANDAGNTPVVPPGTDCLAPVALSRSASQQAELDALLQHTGGLSTLGADQIEQEHAVPFAAQLGYDPLTASRLDTIDASSLALATDEKAILAERGFVVTDHHRFPSFAYGLAAIYAEDLPLYVTADSVLDAVHRSYDQVLEAIEQVQLITDVHALLTGMRAQLAAVRSPAGATLADVDTYLAVALGLLDGQPAPPVAGGDPSIIASLVAGATSHQGTGSVSLFGVAREVDFSQFTPRGHYRDTPELTRYFQAMMWLGRIDLALIETRADGSQVFHRCVLEAAYAMRDLMDADARAAWQRVDDVITGFVGEHDSMTVPQLDLLLADLGLAGDAQLATKSDAEIAQALIAGGYGAQRIASQLMAGGIHGTLPLSSSFLLFGQRYVVDSNVFSNLVYDRVGQGQVMRLMPDPLDVSYAALGNDQAVALLDAQLRRYPYAPDLEAMRALVDAHGPAFWEENLYNLWLGALRALSPGADVASPAASGLPTVAATEAWGRRLLSAQLASWAELRHDTLLYAKQSYTSGNSCAFPDAFVDPYPLFWGRLVAFADRGRALVDALDLTGPEAMALKARVDGWFVALHDVAETLQQMAQSERDGAELTPAQLAFINQAVHVQAVCDSNLPDGWYAQLLFDRAKGTELDPTIADVHTQPTDEAGNPVGRVLHVGTGMPRLIVVTVDRCGAPAAYAGMVLPYFETTTEGFLRLDDQTWSAMVEQATPPEVPWMQNLVAR